MVITKKLFTLSQNSLVLLKIKVIGLLYKILLLQNDTRTLKFLKVDKTGNLIGNIDTILLTNPYGINSNEFSALNFSNLNNDLFKLFTYEIAIIGNNSLTVNYLLEFNKEGNYTGNI